MNEWSFEDSDDTSPQRHEWQSTDRTNRDQISADSTQISSGLAASTGARIQRRKRIATRDVERRLLNTQYRFARNQLNRPPTNHSKSPIRFKTAATISAFQRCTCTHNERFKPDTTARGAQPNVFLPSLITGCCSSSGSSDGST